MQHLSGPTAPMPNVTFLGRCVAHARQLERYRDDLPRYEHRAEVRFRPDRDEAHAKKVVAATAERTSRPCLLEDDGLPRVWVVYGALEIAS